MSLLNKASLIQIPSGYKDGTLYSAKPTNGDGDFTFSRGSNLAATRVNSDGLIEKGRENLLLQSNAITTSPWSGPRIFSQTSGHAGYDGSNDAWLVIPNSTNGTHYKVQSVSTPTSVVTISVYAKSGGYDYIAIRDDSSGNSYARFDLSLGVTSITGTNAITSKIEDVGNGWYRCSLTYTETATGNILFYVNDAYDYAGNYSGDEVSGVYFQDFQVEQGLISTPYIETGASTAQAGILEDMPRLDYSGGATCGHLLLEPQRSNVVTQSEYIGAWTESGLTITDNNSNSPEGVSNAAKLTLPSGSAVKRIALGSMPVTAVARSYSFFVKSDDITAVQLVHSGDLQGYARFDISTGVVGSTGTKTTSDIQDYGNGWYRCIANFDSSNAFGSTIFLYINDSATGSYGGSTSAEGDLFVYGAQYEAGSYPTSYIPTYGSGSSVTRGADDAVATHTISDTETLTYYTEFIAPEQAGGGGEHLLENSSGSSRIRIYQNNSTSIRIRTDSPSSNFDYSYSSLGIDVGDIVKIALSIDSGVMTAFINGVQKNTFGSATINFARLHLRPSTIINTSTEILFDSALSDDECIQLTTI